MAVSIEKYLGNGLMNLIKHVESVDVISGLKSSRNP